MKARPRFKSSVRKKIDENSDPSGARRNVEFARETRRQKARAIKLWWRKYGGEFFLRWALKYYRTHKEDRLSLDEPFFQSYLRAIGNPWFARILVLKGAQMGYTESTIALIAFNLSVVRTSSIFCVEQQNKLLDIVAPRFQPSFAYIRPIQELRQQIQQTQGKSDTNTRQRLIEVGGVPVYFAYAGVSSGSSKEPNRRQVSSSLSSVPIDGVVVADEIEAFPAGAIDILYERTNASKLPTCPMRFGSTPGGHGGIVDMEKRKSLYDFDWFVKCPHCQHEQFLDVFGNLFLSRTTEEGEVDFVDEIGDPVDWFAKEQQPLQRKIQTAYIGCKDCGEEISQEAIADGEYRCRKTGKELNALGEEQLQKQEAIYETICLNMPRLAARKLIPGQRIARIKRSSNKMDGWQQGFGVIISLSGGHIPWEKIAACLRELPSDLRDLQEPDLVVLGVDQGVEHHWGIVQYWYWDEEAADELKKLRTEGGEECGQQERDRDLWVTARKQVVWFGPLWGRDGIEKAARDWRCDFVGMDVEPETELSSVLARRYRPNRANGNLKIPIRIPRGREWRLENKDDPDLFGRYGIVFPFDEVYLVAQDFRRTEREIQGEKVPIFSVDRTVALDAVKNRIYKKSCYFPPSWAESDLTNKENLFYQLQASERYADKNKDRMIWQASDGEPDHGHHADGFAEMAALVWNFVPAKNPFSFGSL